VAFKRLDPESIVPPQLTPEQRWTSTASRPTADGRSVIGSELSIEGPSITMRCKGTLRVDGTIEANLHCAELVIGEQAVIVGSIAANKVAVSGRVNGAIFGNEVFLHSNAQVHGDISSCSLGIEEGGHFRRSRAQSHRPPGGGARTPALAGG
jgi:cytoskeletal protein CcmA (bactofilin family)